MKELILRQHLTHKHKTEANGTESLQSWTICWQGWHSSFVFTPPLEPMGSPSQVIFCTCSCLPVHTWMQHACLFEEMASSMPKLSAYCPCLCKTEYLSSTKAYAHRHKTLQRYGPVLMRWVTAGHKTESKIGHSTDLASFHQANYKLGHGSSMAKLQARLDCHSHLFQLCFQSCDLQWPRSLRRTPGQYCTQSCFQFHDLTWHDLLLWIFSRMVHECYVQNQSKNTKHWR